MSEIKVGDIVKRIKFEHCGMRVGDTAKVLMATGGECVTLDGFKGEHFAENLEVVTQQKTIADVYKYYKGKSPFDDVHVLGVAWSINRFVPYYYGSQLARGAKFKYSYIICTRQQFEAYAKEQEAKQDEWTHVCIDKNEKCYIVQNRGNMALISSERGVLRDEFIDNLKPINQEPATVDEQEKWTHTHLGENCKIKLAEPDCHGYMLVVTEGNGYQLCRQEEMKPIKPRITKAQAWDKLMERKTNSAEVNTLKQQYDII